MIELSKDYFRMFKLKCLNQRFQTPLRLRTRSDKIGVYAIYCIHIDCIHNTCFSKANTVHTRIFAPLIQFFW